MWELDCEERLVPKNWCFWTVVLEKTLESPLDCKEIQPVHSKGDQSWVFFGRNDAEAETPVLWPPHAKSWLIGKDSDAGRGWEQEEKGTTEDEIDGWMASLTRWTWVSVISGSWWWTGRPGVLQSMGSQRVRHDWLTDLIWSDLKVSFFHLLWKESLNKEESLCCNAMSPVSCCWNENQYAWILYWFSLSILSNWQVLCLILRGPFSGTHACLQEVYHREEMIWTNK